MATLVWSVFSYFFIPVMLFVYCYGRIVHGCHEKADESHGGPQHRRFNPDERIAGPVQTSHVTMIIGT